MPSRRLRRQLPIWIAFVLTVTVVLTGWAAYYQLHRAIVASVGRRLETAANEVGALLHASLVRPRAEVTRLAGAPELAAAIASESPRAVAAARAVLAKARLENRAIGSLALWAADGAEIASDGPRPLVIATRPTAIVADDSGAVGKLIPSDSGFGYSVQAPIRIRGQVVGVVIRAQRSTTGGASAAAVSRLVGAGSRISVGNADGSLWTDLARVVPAPPRQAGASVVEFRDGAGTAHIGKATGISGTPWSIWVELPETSAAIGPVHAFRTKGLLLAAALALLGGLASWAVVRRVARAMDSRELAERAELLEAKNAELHQSELRFRQLVNHLPDALIVHRAARITFANPVAARILGLAAAEDALGRSILEFVHAEAVSAAPEILGLNGILRAPTEAAAIRLVRADRSEATVEVSAMSVGLDGQPAVQMIMRDVTERRALEDQLRQSQKMEAIGRLAGGVAHDFNNLLTVIQTYADLTLRATPESDPRSADLGEILHAARSAAGLTRQMLAFSRQQVLEPRRVDVNAATGGVIEMIKRVIGDNIEVRAQLRDGTHAIWADPGQLEQVLMNLAVNARDAMPNGGMLRIETANAHLDAGYASYHGQAIPAGDYVLLSVADTGIGMSEDLQRKIFEPFFTTKDSGKGTGLGLSTVYGIVKQSDGHIWVYSEPGQGTVFKIYFPRFTGPQEPEVLPVPVRPLRRDRGASVLLIEDEPHVRAAIRRMLESLQFKVVEADGPSSALELFRNGAGQVDLVLTDMMMPERTGAELVRELTAIRPNLRAIIMSGYSEEATSRQWRLPPNSHFIEKPIDPAELVRMMSEALGWSD